MAVDKTGDFVGKKVVVVDFLLSGRVGLEPLHLSKKPAAIKLLGVDDKLVFYL